MNFSGCCADKIRNEHRPKKPQSPQPRSRIVVKTILFSFSSSKMRIIDTKKLKPKIF